MKSSSKIIMLAAATAVVSSAITAYAMKQVLFPAEEAQSFNELFLALPRLRGREQELLSFRPTHPTSPRLPKAPSTVLSL